MSKRKVLILLLISMVLSASATYFLLNWRWEERVREQQDLLEIPEGGAQENQDYLEKIGNAFHLIKTQYVGEVNEEKLTEGAIQGMLTVLNDPYSVYMNREEASRFSESLDSSFEGIGAEITKIDGKIIIVSPLKNSPAEKAGLKPYDQILKVDGADVTNKELNEVTLKIRGKKGTKVVLEILRNGLEKPISVEVKRDTIPIETVYSSLEEANGKKIGYIEITSFSRDTGEEFADHLKKLERKKIAGLIIDVRGNPGGLLTSVEEIASQLITGDKPIVQIEKKDGERETIFSKLKKRKGYPIAVLTDEGSASASEILAAALKEGEGYPVIGERTFGKGTVQQQISLGDGSNMKLTMYKWLTPNGNWIHGKGIEPDVEVEQPALFHLQPLQLKGILKRDMNDEQIKQAQFILKELGYEPGRTDGYFDETTEAAVKVFQHDNRLPETGVIDGKTAKAMEKVILEEKENKANDRQLKTSLKYLSYMAEK